MAELEFEDIQAQLSTHEQLTEAVLTRRTFLKAAAAGVSISMLPDFLQDAAAFAAPPLGADEGVLVVIQMGGGNDGLNTVVPYTDAAYAAKRGGLAISGASALKINGTVGLHPALVKLKERYDRGDVAIVQGVGYTNPDLSHFSSVATWQSGWAPGGARTGWLGRYLDGLGTDPLYGVNIGTSIPMHLKGVQTAATSLPLSSGGVFASNQNDVVTRRLADALRNMGVSDTGKGALANKIATVGRTGMDIGSTVSPCYSPALPSGNLVPQMELTARLINANLGTRVFGVSCGSFDSHDNQAYEHNIRLAELDAGIEQFFATLSPAFAGRVTVLTFSEFGRRVEANGSAGTDHGTSAPLFVIGSNVRGGLYGAQPSLTSLDSNGNMRPALTFHSVYATILDRWLRADASGLLGANVDKLDLFEAAPSGAVVDRPQPVTPPVAVAPVAPLPTTRPFSYPNSYRLVTAKGAVSSYGGAPNQGRGDGRETFTTIASTPSQRGYWLASASGGVNAFGDAPFHGSMAGKPLNSPIIGMTSSASGNGYWLLGKDGGIFSFGDAAFYGSTGDMRLNQPVVGMTAVPTGGGYWFVAADGGIFCFGPGAQFYGSTGDIRLNKPIVGMAATPTGRGYWLVASDGGVFCFGDANFYGSTGDIRLNQPIVGMAATPTGKGYRFVGADGGVFTFGDATFEGSLGGNPGKEPVVGITT